jgi:(1->4)-alpha-D-glucan 1-alpha-D-glucosylmutase
MREAKQNTSWINRNEEYENAVSSFVKALLNPDPENQFLKDFLPFQQRVARIGLWNSLSQTLLKLTCPGVPDIYQGNELWDFSLVDPDNRRPVDYLRRQQTLESVRGSGDSEEYSAARLMENPEGGRMKLHLTAKALLLRQQHPKLFQDGEYLPLAVSGTKADHVVAFTRKLGTDILLVVAPRLITGLVNDNDGDYPPIGIRVWGDTRISLPSCACPKKYCNVLTGKLIEAGSEVNVAEILADFPVALCMLS